jgi:hypothetical protein
VIRRTWLAPALAGALVTAVAVTPAAAAGPHQANRGDVAPAANSTLYQDSFAGTDTALGAWTTVSTSGGGGPCLTAASGKPAGGIPVCPGGATDQPGSGMLQLTDNAKSESGYVISNNPIIAKDGAHISFDMAQYDAKQSGGRGGDGLSFFLVDGSVASPSAGKAGGALGYQGLQGAILGIGFDEYGNFSTTIGGVGGPGQKPDSVVVRGAASTDYRYLTGKTSPQPLPVDSARSRAKAVRHVSIDITGNTLTVRIAYGQGAQPVQVIGPLDLSSVPGQPALPSTFKYGFAASTGAATAYHGITNLTASGLAPVLSLSLAHQGMFTAGGTGSYQMSVSDNAKAGPTIAPVTLTLPMPKGLTATSASGDGWTCSVATGMPTCTRPGTGPDTLQPGASYPPITVGVAIPAGPGGSITVDGAARTDPGPPTGVTAIDVATVAPSPTATPAPTPPPGPGPDLGLAVTPQGDFVAGGTGGYQLTMSNAPQAGPTTGTVTATFSVPAGQTVRSATGSGWTCTTSGQAVTCTRPGNGLGSLGGGASYPPVTISTKIASSASATVDVTGTVNTVGNASANGGQGKASVTIAPAPAAGSVVCRGGTIEATIGPGITFQTKTVRLTGEGDTGQCQSPTDPSITGGTFTFAATGQGECPNGLNANGTGTIMWNNGQVSSVQVTAVLSPDQIGEASFHVVQGEFAGDSGQFAGPITYLPWYNCVSPAGVEFGRATINEGFLNP